MATLYCTQCATSVVANCSCVDPHYVPHHVMIARRKEIATKLSNEGMTQSAIAKRLGVSQTQINFDLNGRSKPTLLQSNNVAKKDTSTTNSAPKSVVVATGPPLPSPPPMPPRKAQTSKELTKREPTLEQRIAKLEKTYRQIVKIREKGVLPHKLVRELKALAYQPENVSEARRHQIRSDLDVYEWLMAEKYKPTPTLTDVGISKEKVK